MSLRAWKWVAGLTSFLLLSIPAVYTWLVLARAPEESWDWGHQLAATFFSVVFAFAVAVWLYAWQTGRANVDRKNELRAAQIINIFDMWNLLDDENLQTVVLPDGSEAKVLLTFLQPTIYEESIRSGLFGTAETMTMSRLAAIMHIYNGSAQRLLPLLKSVESAGSEEVDTRRVEGVRDEIDTVLSNREKVVEAGQRLLNLWTLKEIRAALAVADPNSREDPDPRVAHIVEEHLPNILPPSYKAGIHTKLGEAKKAAQEGNIEAACDLLDEIIIETRELRGNEITTESADELISAATDAKENLGRS